MASEVLLRGTVDIWLGPVDTPRPSAPNIDPAAAWEKFGDSYFDDAGVTMMIDKTREKDYVLNEAEAVDVFGTVFVKSIAGNLKNYALEAMTHVLNGNAITITPPTATDVGFRDIDLDIGTLVKNYAVLCRIGASPYDQPNVKTADFMSEIWYPRAFEDGQVEATHSPKATTMYAFMFEGLRSNVPANRANLRTTDLAHN